MDIINAEVVVVGAGLAGVCAALAAARIGQSTVLVCGRPVLGGNSSTEIRMWTRGACGAGNLFSEEMGILGELKMRNLQTNPEGNVLYWSEVLLDTVLAQPNLTLLLNTYVTDLSVDGTKVTSVIGHQLNSERTYAFHGKVFIDATGDGTLGALAGIPYHQGGDQHAITKQVATTDERGPVFGSSIYYQVKNMGYPVPFVAPKYIYGMEHIQRMLNQGGRIVDEKQSGADYWWFEFGGLLDTIRDAQQIDLELKRISLGVWNYIKNSGKFPADNLSLEWIGEFAGKRESRRMVTDYILDREDLEAQKTYPDVALHGGWYMDIHPHAGVYSEEENCIQIPVGTYSIPMRCLYNSKMDNLLFAGRTIGTTRDAFASTRIMNTCALSGQAAGTLAAFSVQSSATVAQTAASQTHAIQQRLLRDDMLLPGIAGADEGDLARKATVTASDYVDRFVPTPTGSLPLRTETFLCFPAHKDAQSVALWLDVSKDTELVISLYEDVLPSRLNLRQKLSSASHSLRAGSQKLSMSLPVRQSNRFIVAILEANPHVAVKTCDMAPTGYLMGGVRSMQHVFPCIEIDLLDLYSPAMLTNGFHRPYMQPNLWLSANPQAEVTLHWDAPQTITQALLYLNPDLSKELPSSRTQYWGEMHMLTARDGRPPQLVETISLQYKQGETWVECARIEDNWQRAAWLHLDTPVKTQDLKFVFHSNGPCAYAQAFELRVYA